MATALQLPTARNRADGGVDEGDVLMSRVPEADEPLTVQRPRHLLQHVHPSPVVLDQVVEGAQDLGDLILRWRFAGRLRRITPPIRC